MSDEKNPEADSDSEGRREHCQEEEEEEEVGRTLSFLVLREDFAKTDNFFEQLYEYKGHDDSSGKRFFAVCRECSRLSLLDDPKCAPKLTYFADNTFKRNAKKHYKTVHPDHPIPEETGHKATVELSMIDYDPVEVECKLDPDSQCVGIVACNSDTDKRREKLRTVLLQPKVQLELQREDVDSGTPDSVTRMTCPKTGGQDNENSNGHCIFCAQEITSSNNNSTLPNRTIALTEKLLFTTTFVSQLPLHSSIRKYAKNRKRANTTFWNCCSTCLGNMQSFVRLVGEVERVKQRLETMILGLQTIIKETAMKKTASTGKAGHYTSGENRHEDIHFGDSEEAIDIRARKSKIGVEDIDVKPDLLLLGIELEPLSTTATSLVSEAVTPLLSAFESLSDNEENNCTLSQFSESDSDSVSDNADADPDFMDFEDDDAEKSDIVSRKNKRNDRTSKDDKQSKKYSTHGRSSTSNSVKWKCHVCKMQFNWKHNRDRHLLSVHADENDTSAAAYKPFKCEDCGKVFATLSNCSKHQQITHTDRRKWKCEFCGMAFNWKNNLDRHLRIVHAKGNTVDCQECGKTFASSSSLKKHTQSVHLAKKWKCPHCTWSFTTKQNMQRHVNCVHDEAIVIPARRTEESIITEANGNADDLNSSFDGIPKRKCKLLAEKVIKRLCVEERTSKCTDEVSSDDGNDEDNNEMDEALDSDPLCEPDDDSTSSDSDFDSSSNVKIDDPPKNPPKKKKGMRRTKSEQTNAETEDLMVVCSKCGKSLSKLYILEHERRVHKERKYECKKCEMKFLRDAELQEHVSLHGPDDDDDVVNNDASSDKVEYSVHCPKCDDYFRNKKDLFYHQLKNHPADHNRHICTYCGRNMFTPTNLKRHERSVHGHGVNKDDPLLPKCPECNESFATHLSLKRHVRTVHENKNVLTCILCSIPFPTLGLFKQHAKTLHYYVEGGCKEQCLVCGEKFKTVHERMQHFRATHTKLETFQCPHCPKKFARRYVMINHARTHTGEKPFPCPKCGRCFSLSDRMKRHLRANCSDDVEDKERRRRKLREIERNWRATRSHFCPDCKRGYTDVANLNIHMKKYGHGGLAQNV